MGFRHSPVRGLSVMGSGSRCWARVWLTVLGLRVRCWTDCLHVACGEGAVALTRLQKAGKGAQDVDVFQRGVQIAAGTDLSKG